MATLIDIGKASLCLEALPSEILLEISAAILCIDRRSALQLRLTCKALFGPATDVILGKQDLNHSHEPMEQQTRLIHYCHTVRFWLHVEWEPPFDSEGMLDLAIGQNVWAPDLAPIWKHHYSNCASKDTEIHVFHPFSLENSDGEDAETVKITAIELHRQQIAAVQLRQQWPGAFDGSLEKTIREFAPNLRHDARIVFMSQGLASHGNGRTRPQHAQDPPPMTLVGAFRLDQDKQVDNVSSQREVIEICTLQLPDKWRPQGAPPDLWLRT